MITDDVRGAAFRRLLRNRTPIAPAELAAEPGQTSIRCDRRSTRCSGKA